MTTHRLSIAILACIAVAQVPAIKDTIPRNKNSTTAPSRAVANTAQSERVVVIPTAGGQLEISTGEVRENFTRSDSKVLFDFLDLGTTASEIRVDAVYRYHVGMQRAWPLRIIGTSCLVHVGAVRPTLPVAFDSATVERRTASGWARFNKAENLRELERSLTGLPAERAPLYRHQAQEAGRAVVAEFVAEWLVREQQWQRDPEHRVVVLFPGERLPLVTGDLPLAPQ